MAATSTFPYVIVNAFTDSAFGGNPAAIVLLPPGSVATDNALLDIPKMSSISRSFAQPITVFFSPSSDSDKDLVYDIRFVVDGFFVPLCGHGTLATAKAICRGMFPAISKVVAGNSVVKFRTSEGAIVCVRALDSGNGDNTPDSEFYELAVPVGALKEVTEAERNDVQTMVAKALRKDTDDVGLKYVARGVGSIASYRFVIVLDQNEKLEGRDVDINAFVSQFEATFFLTDTVLDATTSSTY